MERNRKRNTTLFLTRQAVSLFGSMLVQFAIMWHVTLETQSGSAMTLYVVVGVLPTFFMSPFGGVWADRFNRKLLINLADGVIAFVSLVVAITLMLGYNAIWLLFVCAAFRALGQGVHSPAIGSFIPQITPEEHLTKINGINSSIQSFAMIAAPMASGALLTFVSLETLFFIDVITAATGISIVYFCVKIPKTEKVNNPANELPAKTDINYFHDLREGIRYILKNGFLWRMMLIATVFHIMFSPAAFLTPLQVTRNFGADVWRLTAIEITLLLIENIPQGGFICPVSNVFQIGAVTIKTRWSILAGQYACVLHNVIYYLFDIFSRIIPKREIAICIK